MFKAQRTDGKGMFRADTVNGETIYGWVNVKHFNEPYYYINTERTDKAGVKYHRWMLVEPSTLSMKTGQLDKNEKDIYGSFDLEEFGMTSGGDRVSGVTLKTDEYKCFSTRYRVGICKLYNGVFCIETDDDEIISRHSLDSIGKDYLEIIPKHEEK